MFHPLFHLAMREQRLNLGITQYEAGMRCGLSSNRWSNIECGHRTPTSQEQRRIAIALGLRQGHFVAPRSAILALSNSGSRLAEKFRPFFSHQDRPTFIRFRACQKRFPSLTSDLLAVVSSRSDFALCESLCHLISCDSWLESLHLLYLLACGAEPCLLAPERLGRLSVPVVSDTGRNLRGLNPRPCLVLDGSFYFFQVSFILESLVRVDVLRWDGCWSVLEIDGRGHDSFGDRQRLNGLQLRVERIDERALLELCEELRTVSQAS